MAEAVEPRGVFVITPIGKDNSQARVRADDLFELVIEPVITAYNATRGDAPELKPVRADKLEKPGLITQQIVRAIVDSPFVIVDLAGHNPNVFYELGLADAFRVPTIRLSDRPGELPFDVNDHRTILLAHIDDGRLAGRDVERVKEEMQRQVSEVMRAEFEISSVVVSAALEAQLKDLVGQLSGSDDDAKQVLGVLSGQIVSMQEDLQSVRRLAEGQARQRALPDYMPQDTELRNLPAAGPAAASMSERTKTEIRSLLGEDPPSGVLRDAIVNFGMFDTPLRNDPWFRNDEFLEFAERIFAGSDTLRRYYDATFFEPSSPEVSHACRALAGEIVETVLHNRKIRRRLETMERLVAEQRRVQSSGDDDETEAEGAD